ncbi:MAG TPA: 50S ribosomal protein L29 [Candidatus Paceibacterota bacterium]|jgi:ribosomal protein L29|nr:50S ribosomal protein L29 [Candidatus Paceibacterota bacterium]
MKKKDIQELKNRTKEELAHLVHEEQVKLRTLRFELAAGKVKDVNALRETKKKIARMNTFLGTQIAEAPAKMKNTK